MVEISLGHRRARTFAPTPALSTALSDPASVIEKLTAAEYKSVLDSKKWTRMDTELVVKLATACYPLPIDWTSISIRLPKFSKGECRERYENACATIASRAKTIDEGEKMAPKKSTKRKSKAKKKIWKPSDFDCWDEPRQKAWMNIAVNPNAYYMEFGKPGVPLFEGEWGADEISLFQTLLVQRPPEGQWGLFSMLFPNRTGVQCQLLYESLANQENCKQSRREDYLKNNKRRKRLRRCDYNVELGAIATCNVTSLLKSKIEDSDVASPSHQSGTEATPIADQQMIQGETDVIERNDSAPLQTGESVCIQNTVFSTETDACLSDTGCNEPIPVDFEQNPDVQLPSFHQEYAKSNNIDILHEELVEDKLSLQANEAHTENEEPYGHDLAAIEPDSVAIFTDSEPTVADVVMYESKEPVESSKATTPDLLEPENSEAILTIPMPVVPQTSNLESQLYEVINSLRKQFLSESENLHLGFRNSSERLKIVYRERIAQTKDPETHLTLLARFADEASNLVMMMRIQSDCLANVQCCQARRYLALGLIEIPRTPIPDMQL